MNINKYGIEINFDFDNIPIIVSSRDDSWLGTLIMFENIDSLFDYLKDNFQIDINNNNDNKPSISYIPVFNTIKIDYENESYDFKFVYKCDYNCFCNMINCENEVIEVEPRIILIDEFIKMPDLLPIVKIPSVNEITLPDPISFFLSTVNIDKNNMKNIHERDYNDIIKSHSKEDNFLDICNKLLNSDPNIKNMKLKDQWNV